MLMENVRYTLAQYNPSMSLYIGHRYAVAMDQVKSGYMSGGNTFVFILNVLNLT